MVPPTFLFIARGESNSVPRHRCQMIWHSCEQTIGITHPFSRSMNGDLSMEKPFVEFILYNSVKIIREANSDTNNPRDKEVVYERLE